MGATNAPSRFVSALRNYNAAVPLPRQRCFMIKALLLWRGRWMNVRFFLFFFLQLGRRLQHIQENEGNSGPGSDLAGEQSGKVRESSIQTS